MTLSAITPEFTAPIQVMEHTIALAQIDVARGEEFEAAYERRRAEVMARLAKTNPGLYADLCRITPGYGPAEPPRQSARRPARRRKRRARR